MKSFDVKTRISKLKSSAKQRGIFVNLDINKYQRLIDLGCFYCGSSLENEKGYCLDRIESNKGYIITNVVGCCKICNRAKSDMNIWDFTQWINKANIHTQKIIKNVQDQLNNEIHYTERDFINNLTDNKPKQRIKYIP